MFGNPKWLERCSSCPMPTQLCDTGSVVKLLRVERSFEVPRICVHVVVEMGGNKTKAVNFCLVEECDRYES